MAKELLILCDETFTFANRARSERKEKEKKRKKEFILCISLTGLSIRPNYFLQQGDSLQLL
jgi:hypothetical protein